MSLLDLPIDPNNVMDENRFTLLPAGKYNAAVTNAEIKPTKDGTGQLLKATFTILSGKFKNRKLFENYNIHNKSEQAQTIGRGALNTVCMAIGLSGTLNHANELLNKPLNITVNQRKDDYAAEGKSNGITYYAKYSDLEAAEVPVYTGGPTDNALPNYDYGVTGTPGTTYAPVDYNQVPVGEAPPWAG